MSNQQKVTKKEIEDLQRELVAVRTASIDATRQGNFMKVARLTAVTARINKTIMTLEGEYEAQGTK
jgi:hypothetical protein